MICSQCGEQMEGDGYSTPYRCPNVVVSRWEFYEPDCNPVDCQEDDYIYE